MMPNRVLVSSQSSESIFQIEVIVDGLPVHPCMVLLPSSLRDSEDLDDIAKQLAAHHFYVLRPQPRGMGRSSAPPESMSLSTLACDVATCIEQLGQGPAIVIGHAFGHWVARVLDMDYPQHVAAVVVLAGAAKIFPNGLSNTLAIAADTSLPDEERLEALRVCMFAPGSDPSVWLKGWHPNLGVAFRKAGQSPPKDTWFGRSHSPILDLQGACDVWRPVSTRDELKELLGEKVTVQVIEQAGHAMIPEQPQAVVQAIVHWVECLQLKNYNSPSLT